MMDSDSDNEATQPFRDIEYTAPQVHSAQHLNPSILELDAQQATSLGLPAVPLLRLPYDDDFGSSRWVEKEDFENAHHQNLFRLTATPNSFNVEETLKADIETESAIAETQQLRQDSVVEGDQKQRDGEDDIEMEQDANETTPISNEMRDRRRYLASPTPGSSPYNQGVNFSSDRSQSKPIIIDSDEDDTPQPPMITDPDSDDSPQPATSNLAASPTVTNTTSSQRAPPGTWTTDLRTLLNEFRRDDGDFRGNAIKCAQVIKSLYPNFALAHLSNKELAGRVNAQWKERDYPNRPDWVRIHAMRVEDEGMRAGIRARIRGTGIV
ncbi:hypothetical protein AC579_5165 [Pseudocercospora musae]|uniref:Uncharacterized protein n=1 Tax=Pseudocercospora musae TaxID=113226 RepID=A0A139I037_9PEZI|nr:hypothetical protein AC579_5165 [Pseudocercospora musae]